MIFFYFSFLYFLFETALVLPYVTLILSIKNHYSFGAI